MFDSATEILLQPLLLPDRKAAKSLIFNPFREVQIKKTENRYDTIGHNGFYRYRHTAPHTLAKG